MARSHGYGVYMTGFTSLSRALARIEGEGLADFGLAYELRARLRAIGDKIGADAPQFLTHATGRHGSDSQPRLEDSVRVSVTTRTASVYSSAIYGGVQNVGGRIGRRHATLLTRGQVSNWMDRSVATNAAFVQAEAEGLTEWLLAEFHA